eukprot:15065338-Alexandrium_andersonii.AAC.1
MRAHTHARARSRGVSPSRPCPPQHQQHHPRGTPMGLCVTAPGRLRAGIRDAQGDVADVCPRTPSTHLD